MDSWDWLGFWLVVLAAASVAFLRALRRAQTGVDHGDPVVRPIERSLT